MGVKRLVAGTSIALPVIIVLLLCAALSDLYYPHCYELANVFETSGPIVVLFVVCLLGAEAAVIGVLGWLLLRGQSGMSESQADVLRWTYLMLAAVQVLVVAVFVLLAFLVRASVAELSMVDVIK